MLLRLWGLFGGSETVLKSLGSGKGKKEGQISCQS
jgi:hypothetical protein